jgi:hypothetical protein
MIEAQLPLPHIVPPPGRLTEREIRIAGHTCQRLITLRTMVERSSAGGTIQTSAGTLQLQNGEMIAVLALLIERDEQLLIGLDIQLDREGS